MYRQAGFIIYISKCYQIYFHWCNVSDLQNENVTEVRHIINMLFKWHYVFIKTCSCWIIICLEIYVIWIYITRAHSASPVTSTAVILTTFPFQWYLMKSSSIFFYIIIITDIFRNVVLINYFIHPPRHISNSSQYLIVSVCILRYRGHFTRMRCQLQVPSITNGQIDADLRISSSFISH